MKAVSSDEKASYGSPGNFEPAFPMLPLMFKNGRVRVTGGFAPTAENLAEIRRALDARRLVPRIWKELPLFEIAVAHVEQEAGLPVGKIVLEIP